MKSIILAVFLAFATIPAYADDVEESCVMSLMQGLEWIVKQHKAGVSLNQALKQLREYDAKQKVAKYVTEIKVRLVITSYEYLSGDPNNQEAVDAVNLAMDDFVKECIVVRSKPATKSI